MSKLLYIISIVFCLTACLTNKKTKKGKSFSLSTFVTDPTSINPPGGIRVNDTLFVDWTERCNIDWKEFNQYNLRIYGDESSQYLESFPDVYGYVRALDRTNKLVVESDVTRDYYYYDIEYDNYPITGITLQQAKQFSKWRSDRVFEGYLIRAGIIKIIGSISQLRNFWKATFTNSTQTRYRIIHNTSFPQLNM